jgi:Sialic acid synthase
MGKEHPAFKMAEVGINQKGTFEKAIKLMEEAQKPGASTGKIQTYKNEEEGGKRSPHIRKPENQGR